jgi:uncharacterized membrane protein
MTGSRSPTPARPRRAWYHPGALARSFALRPRVLVGAAMGLVALLVLPRTLPFSVRCSIAWDIGGLAYLILAFRLIRSCPVELIRRRAAVQDESGFVILAIVLLAIASSFAAIVGLIADAKTAAPGAKLAYVVIAGATIVISWLVMQVLFAVHYAHEHYAPAAGDSAAPGLIFPDDPTPDYWDFIYFSTSIGATSQTSDVSIRSKAVRRLVTVHAVTAFFFNTTVLALTINLAASLI